jgi:hypothetical protein
MWIAIRNTDHSGPEQRRSWQCCGSGSESFLVTWIRIRIIKIRICIIIYKLDPEPDRNADVKPKCMEYEPILNPSFEARIWIRIRIRVKTTLVLGFIHFRLTRPYTVD